MENAVNKNISSIFGVVVLSVFFIISYLILKDLLEFADGQPAVVGELLSAAFATIITVSAMSVMLKFQSRQDRDKEYAAQLFDRKLSIYMDLLQMIFEAADDNCISKEEIVGIENKIGTACLISNENLVSTFSQFMIQLKIYGVIYYRSMSLDQRSHFSDFLVREKEAEDINKSYLSRKKYILPMPVRGNEPVYFVSLDDIIQDIRSDLSIIGGNVREEIEHFITTGMDAYGLMGNPNMIEGNYGKNFEKVN